MKERNPESLKKKGKNAEANYRRNPELTEGQEKETCEGKREKIKQIKEST